MNFPTDLSFSVEMPILIKKEVGSWIQYCKFWVVCQTEPELLISFTVLKMQEFYLYLFYF